MLQVTSKGCSRAYIISVLFRALKYARNRLVTGYAVSFPFDHDVINQWLLFAQDDCNDLDFQREFGSVDFYPDDPKTYWNVPAHFFTWWKNNIERKAKFLTLINDASYTGSDDKLKYRAFFCKEAILLSINIKNHFQRILNQQIDKSVIFQLSNQKRPLNLDQPKNKTVIFVDFNDYLNCISQYQISSNFKISDVFHKKSLSKAIKKSEESIKDVEHNNNNNSSKNTSETDTDTVVTRRHNQFYQSKEILLKKSISFTQPKEVPLSDAHFNSNRSNDHNILKLFKALGQDSYDNIFKSNNSSSSSDSDRVENNRYKVKGKLSDTTSTNQENEVEDDDDVISNTPKFSSTSLFIKKDEKNFDFEKLHMMTQPDHSEFKDLIKFRSDNIFNESSSTSASLELDNIPGIDDSSRDFSLSINSDVNALSFNSAVFSSSGENSDSACSNDVEDFPIGNNNNNGLNGSAFHRVEKKLLPVGMKRKVAHWDRNTTFVPKDLTVAQKSLNMNIVTPTTTAETWNSNHDNNNNNNNNSDNNKSIEEDINNMELDNEATTNLFLSLKNILEG